MQAFLLAKPVLYGSSTLPATTILQSVGEEIGKACEGRTDGAEQLCFPIG